MNNHKKNNYHKIIKSTSIIGGSQVLNIVFGILRIKVIAVLLGPLGIGLISVLQSIVDLTKNVTGLGIPFSSVKDIAESKGKNSEVNLSKIITVVKRWSIATAIFGSIVLILGSEKISYISFNTENHFIDVALLSIALFFTTLTANNLAILQGMKKIKSIALTQVISGFISSILVIPVYYFWRLEGIAYSLILIAIVSYVSARYFVRKIESKILFDENVTIFETLKLGQNMVRMGFFMSINIIMSLLTLYFTRSYIAAHIDIDSVGLFQAVYTITNVYTGLIFSAMLTDFFPRLSENNKDNSFVNKCTNEQSLITLLFGVPIIATLIAFSYILLYLLYSEEFIKVVDVLQLRLYATSLSLISWPVGVIFLAKGKGHLSMINDFIINGTYTLLVIFLWNHYELYATSIAYLLSIILSVIFTISVAAKLTQFRFSALYIKLALTFIALITLLSYLTLYVKGNIYMYILQGSILVLIWIISLMNIHKLVGFGSLIAKRKG